MHDFLNDLLGDSEERVLSDGFYSLSEEIDVLNVSYSFDESEKQKVRDFVEKYPNFVSANAYETDKYLLLSEKPKKLDTKWEKQNVMGSGFNYGSTNIISNCPSRILILAEND